MDEPKTIAQKFLILADALTEWSALLDAEKRDDILSEALTHIEPMDIVLFSVELLRAAKNVHSVQYSLAESRKRGYMVQADIKQNEKLLHGAMELLGEQSLYGSLEELLQYQEHPLLTDPADTGSDPRLEGGPL